MKSILAADIGGTNSRFAFFEKFEESPLALVESRWLTTTDAGSFAELLAQLADSDFPLTPATADITVIGIAGPVQQGTSCNPPNIDWDIDLTRPQDRAGAQRMELINDFVAQAYACRSPVGQAARVIIPGEPVAGGTVGVLGAGNRYPRRIPPGVHRFADHGPPVIPITGLSAGKRGERPVGSGLSGSTIASKRIRNGRDDNGDAAFDQSTWKQCMTG